jgi:hypothetical protein
LLAAERRVTIFVTSVRLGAGNAAPNSAARELQWPRSVMPTAQGEQVPDAVDEALVSASRTVWHELCAIYQAVEAPADLERARALLAVLDSLAYVAGTHATRIGRCVEPSDVLRRLGLGEEARAQEHARVAELVRLTIAARSIETSVED